MAKAAAMTLLTDEDDRRDEIIFESGLVVRESTARL
jgi:hypothetical protein